jgi:HSP20 family protein
MPQNKRSFFEKLTGSHEKIEPEEIVDTRGFMDELEEEKEEGQLTVDVYQTNNEIILQAFTSGIKTDDLDISITQDMITIKGKREDHRRVERGDFFCQELYWGSFSRTITLPHEVDPDEAEATLKNGILTVKLPKLDRERVQKLKVKGE